MKTTSQKTGVIRPILIGTFAGVLLAGSFILGFFVRGYFPNEVQVASVPLDEAGYPLIDEVQSVLDQIYLREQPDYVTRQYGAVRGMLESLGDRNTFFIDPPVAQSESDVLAGTYGGVGVLVEYNENGDFILYPFADSPAIEAGILDGAVLLAINGETLTPEISRDAIDQMMRGEVIEDNGVELTVLQDAAELTVFIRFDVINIPSVVWRTLEQDTRIGYIQIFRFTSRTPEELRTALQELNASSSVGAIILDLRGNSGGLLTESIEVASEFLDTGVIIHEVTRDNERTFNAEQGGLASQLPIVILVDNSTASAAELVAGAIRDNQRGILIGQSTYGKGTVQQIFPLSDGSSIHVTSAEWLTPNRTPIADVGLIPDIEMIPDENGRDVEIGEAIRYLQEQLENE